MNSLAFVDRAAAMALEMVQAESRGPGDFENAMRRAARKSGVNYSTFWALRYRKPKDILIGVYSRLAGAHERLRQDQLRRLQNERNETSADGWLAQHFVAAADALDGETISNKK